MTALLESERYRMRKTGERQYRAKVSDAHVALMRQLRERHGMSFVEIGRRFGVKSNARWPDMP